MPENRHPEPPKALVRRYVEACFYGEVVNVDTHDAFPHGLMVSKDGIPLMIVWWDEWTQKVVSVSSLAESMLYAG